jgi:hypothetical protein
MKDLYDYLAANKVTPNGLFVLQATYHDFMYANYVNIRSEQYRLSLTGHLKEFKDIKGNLTYQLTNEGLHLIRKAEDISAKIKPTKKTNVPFSDWEEKIVEYNALFPTGKKQGSTVSFRTNPKELFDRFKWFFKEYPEYTWDDVIDATKKYVKIFDESSDYTYMQTSKYFIKKEDKFKTVSSGLGNACYNQKSGNDEEISSGFHYFGP